MRLRGNILPATVQNVRTVCPYCGVGCGMVLSVKDGRVVKVTGDKEHPANFGRLCTKGVTAADVLNAPGRLIGAMVRKSRELPMERLPMGAALAQAVSSFQKIIKCHGPDAVAFYVSGQLSLEAQYLANKLCKGFLGTNNIDSNSRLCMSSAASGYKLSLGADGPPGSYQDIEHSNLFFVIGANMAECHPILFNRVLDRRAAGARMIVVDPRRTPTAEKADLFLQIKPGTDLALLNGLLHLLEKNGSVDKAFISQYTEGWEELRTSLKDYPPGRVAEITGLSTDQILLAARWIAEAPEFMTFWTMGLNQSTHGTWHTNAICNLHLATGKICRPGSGPFSLTGQPNAMGGREVGYMSHALPGQRSVMNAQDREFIENLWQVPAGRIRPEPGLDAVQLFKKLESGEVKAIWIIGSNPVASMPNRQRVIAGLQRAELVVVQDAFQPTETSSYADVLLPGALWGEAEGTMVNSERNVTLMQAAVPPPGEAEADWKIIARAARHFGFGDHFNYATASEVFDEIRATWNSKTGYDMRGITHQKLKRQSVQWPCATGETKGRAIRYVDGSSKPPPGQPAILFATESGRGRFFARPWLPPAELPNGEFPFALSTGRVAHQWHTLTKTGKIEVLNRLNPGAFVEIHPDDAAALGIENNALVKVTSRRGFAVYPAQITTRVRPGDCFAPFHWNDLFGKNLAVNAATSDAVDQISLQPEFKFAAVALERVESKLPGDFSLEQKMFLHEFLSETSELSTVANSLALSVPENSPFTSSQRKSLEDLFKRPKSNPTKYKNPTQPDPTSEVHHHNPLLGRPASGRP